MHDSHYNKFKELNWRRPLRADEAAELRRLLAADPGILLDWQAEEALSRALEQLPPAAVSSNFTARVLAAAQRAQAQPGRLSETPWFFRSWWPRLAAGLFMASVGFFSFQEYHHGGLDQSARARPEAASAGQLASLPPVEWLNNFDTIQRLDKVKVADEELLSALQ